MNNDLPVPVDVGLPARKHQPLTVKETVAAVNTIANYIESRKITPSSQEDGMVAITVDAARTQGLILHAVDTNKVRGYSQGFGMSLVSALGAPAVIHLSLSLKEKYEVRTVTEYLVLYEGDDPIQLFLQTLRRLIPQKTLELKDNYAVKLLT